MMIFITTVIIAIIVAVLFAAKFRSKPVKAEATEKAKAQEAAAPVPKAPAATKPASPVAPSAVIPDQSTRSVDQKSADNENDKYLVDRFAAEVSGSVSVYATHHLIATIAQEDNYVRLYKLSDIKNQYAAKKKIAKLQQKQGDEAKAEIRQLQKKLRIKPITVFLGQIESATSVCLSNDDSLLAVGMGYHNKIRIYRNKHAGQEDDQFEFTLVSETKDKQPSSKGITMLRFVQPDNKFIISMGGAEEDTLYLWDAAQGTLLQRMSLRLGGSAMFDVNSTGLISASSQTSSLRVFALAQEKDKSSPSIEKVKELVGHRKGCPAIALNHDNLLASVSADETLKIWDARRLKVRYANYRDEDALMMDRKLADIDKSIVGAWRVAFAPDSRVLAIIKDKKIVLVSACNAYTPAEFEDAGKLIHAFADMPNTITQFQWIPTTAGNYAFVIVDDKNLISVFNCSAAIYK